MFAKTEDAKALHANLRAILDVPVGSYHIVAYADSGIASLADLKGRKVFLGPPGGAATTVMIDAVKAATGLTPGADYELSKLDWTSGAQAFQDRQIDVYATPTVAPSSSITRFALLNDVRILGFDRKDFESEGLKKVQALPGRTEEVIPVGAYRGVWSTPSRC